MSEGVSSQFKLMAYPSSRVVQPEDALPYAEPADVIDLGFYANHKTSITLEEHEIIREVAARFEQERCAKRLEEGYPLTAIHKRLVAKEAYSYAAELVAGIEIDPHTLRLEPDATSRS